jgi:hypothetical protein
MVRVSVCGAPRVRAISWFCALAACFCLGAVPDATGALSVSVPDTLHVGDHVSLVLTLSLPEGQKGPILLTPRSQGDALEVVRGRLLHADARDPEIAPLVFDVPAIARAPGQAVVHVRALVYRCTDGTCEPLTLETRKTVLVLPR